MRETAPFYLARLRELYRNTRDCGVQFSWLDTAREFDRNMGRRLETEEGMSLARKMSYRLLVNRRGIRRFYSIHTGTLDYNMGTGSGVLDVTVQLVTIIV